MSWSRAQTTYSSFSPPRWGAGRRLQRVFEAIDGESSGVALEQAEVGEHAIGQAAREREVVVGDHGPVLRRPLGHRVELGAPVVHRRHVCDATQ
jgi:hypothetical protein